MAFVWGRSALPVRPLTCPREASAPFVLPTAHPCRLSAGLHGQAVAVVAAAREWRELGRGPKPPATGHGVPVAEQPPPSDRRWGGGMGPGRPEWGGGGVCDGYASRGWCALSA